jgi:hypothetical protein
MTIDIFPGLAAVIRQSIWCYPYNFTILVMQFLDSIRKPAMSGIPGVAEERCCPSLRTWVFSKWVQKGIVKAVY